MAPLIAILLAVAAVPATATAWPGAGPIDRWSPYIAEASARFGIPETWIRSVMRAESGGRTRLNGRPIESPKGAIGLMQVMPATWHGLRRRYGLGEDPADPHDNILAGTAYLREMHDRFGYPGLFAAYNAGPGRYADHLAKGRRLPDETIAYVGVVAGTASPVEAVKPSPVAGILVILSTPQAALAADRADTRPVRSPLFAALSANDPVQASADSAE